MQMEAEWEKQREKKKHVLGNQKWQDNKSVAVRNKYKN